MATIPSTYRESRQYFRDNLKTIRRFWPTARLERAEIGNSGDLTMDWFLAHAQKRREQLLVITTGLHGIEGYIGSAVMQLCIDEFLPRIDPGTTGIVLIHSLNPWGMDQWKRINPNNVDLNRNFIDGQFQSPSLVNADFSRLIPFLCPDRALGSLLEEKARFVFGLLVTILRLGATRLREAALMGQYEYPSGIYFGGHSLQQETRTIMKLYQDSFKGYGRIVHLDLHSGYGPRDQMTVVTSPHEARDAETIKQAYNLGRVAGANPEEFYSMHGDMNDWEYEYVRKKLPRASIFAANFEFGTYGNSFLAEARSLRITILKNQKDRYGSPEKTGEWVDREYRELYLPQESGWYEKVWQDARQGFNGILTAEGILK
jgi:predicted deacylase